MRSPFTLETKFLESWRYLQNSDHKIIYLQQNTTQMRATISIVEWVSEVNHPGFRNFKFCSEFSYFSSSEEERSFQETEYFGREQKRTCIFRIQTHLSIG